MSNLKKILYFVIILNLIFGVYYYFVLKSDRSVIVGTIKSVDNTSLVVYGGYKDDLGKNIEASEITINVSSGTKIQKTTFVRPPAGAMFNVDDLPKEIQNVNYSVLKNDVNKTTFGVEIHLKRNYIWNKSVIAREIKYIGPKY